MSNLNNGGVNLRKQTLDLEILGPVYRSFVNEGHPQWGPLLDLFRPIYLEYVEQFARRFHRTDRSELCSLLNCELLKALDKCRTENRPLEEIEVSVRNRLYREGKEQCLRHACGWYAGPSRTATRYRKKKGLAAHAPLLRKSSSTDCEARDRSALPRILDTPLYKGPCVIQSGKPYAPASRYFNGTHAMNRKETLEHYAKTPEEEQVASMLIDGDRKTEIAQDLGISLGRVLRIMDRMGAIALRDGHPIAVRAQRRILASADQVGSEGRQDARDSPAAQSQCIAT